MTTETIRTSHWADTARQTIAELSANLPAVLESNFDLWEHRVSRSEETPFVPHTSLFAMEALEYERTESEPGKGQSEPTGKTFSFLVVADCRREAVEKVNAQLAAHGFDPANFMQRSTGNRLLILA
jgi:hypothetical protein